MNTVPTVADTKRTFLRAFPHPISAVYRKIIDELLVELHLLTVDTTFRYDCVFALGTVTIFDQFMEGYRGDVQPLWEALIRSVRLDPQQLRQDAQKLIELVDSYPQEVQQLLTSLKSTIDLSPLDAHWQAIAANPRFKYSRLFAVGLFTLIAKLTPEEAQRTDLLKQACQALYPHWGLENSHPADRFLRDLDIYRSNLEKVQQTKQMMADLVEAERKKKAKQSSA
ncbi:MAG: photosystem II biogenesis protein Psp29 [Pseudanabaenaceae cyanobacterium SKYGB_i_bin29]|nr:photosystem II biogenesis protein Psp29 [Pseudanabaenaceae cyanobacterium SKYG29]MDW8420970.1 photosystem II biogenesis protein Psp29 [Pseudanabaenaceae cyanobacterium SKYGB_i_bin29]